MNTYLPGEEIFHPPTDMFPLRHTVTTPLLTKYKDPHWIQPTARTASNPGTPQWYPCTSGSFVRAFAVVCSRASTGFPRIRRENTYEVCFRCIGNLYRTTSCRILMCRIVYFFLQQCGRADTIVDQSPMGRVRRVLSQAGVQPGSTHLPVPGTTFEYPRVPCNTQDSTPPEMD